MSAWSEERTGTAAAEWPLWASFRRMLARLFRSPSVAFGLAVLTLLSLMAIFAPFLWTVDPLALDPRIRLRPPSAEHWFGTDGFGRDTYSRTIYGSRISLIVGLSVAALTMFVGTLIGLVAGFFRIADAILLRVMDALMAIPSILLAVALLSITEGSLFNVILAISIADLPKVVRLVRSVVLSIREQPYVEAAIAVGTRAPDILRRHILPNILSPLIVQATLICASAILTEAGLSFLGVGTPAEIPSWGNIIATGRSFFMLSPWMIVFPGAFLIVTVLAINFLGDGLRDLLDPRLRNRL
jgi:peptide/nickel transport system permease protein